MPGGHFTCSDGICIDIEERCDGAQHCPLVNLPQGYLKEFAPITVKRDLLILKTEIRIDISIRDVINIDVKAGSLGFQFIMSMTWKDGRVTYYNLQENTNRNKT